jgi:hypothetical protein
VFYRVENPGYYRASVRPSDIIIRYSRIDPPGTSQQHNVLYALNDEALTGFRLWRQYWRQFWGYIFFRGHISLKIGHIAPFLATIQRLSKTRVFLYTSKVALYGPHLHCCLPVPALFRPFSVECQWRGLARPCFF